MLFVALRDVVDGLPQNVALANLRVTHDVPCVLTHRDAHEEQGRFTIVECLASDASITAYFLDLAQTMLLRLPQSPSHREFDRELSHLTELFRRLREPSRKEAAGLWAELFLIVNARQPLTMLRAWHSDVAERFDFSEGEVHLEVKSVQAARRLHHLSLEQAHPPQGSVLLFASLQCRPSTGGTSIHGLVQQARSLCGGNLALVQKVDRVVGDSLGSDVSRLDQFRFDDQVAFESLLYFDWRAVPSLPVPLPAGVSGVRFVSDFDLADSMGALDGLVSLFAALPAASYSDD